jgi:hypothetical protein
VSRLDKQTAFRERSGSVDSGDTLVIDIAARLRPPAQPPTPRDQGDPDAF